MSCVYPWKFQEWKLCFLISLHNMDANYYLSSTCESVQWPASNIILLLPRPHTTFVWFLPLFCFFIACRFFDSANLSCSTWGGFCPFSTRISRQREFPYVQVNIVYIGELRFLINFREIKNALLSLGLGDENWFWKTIDSVASKCYRSPFLIYKSALWATIRLQNDLHWFLGLVTE